MLPAQPNESLIDGIRCLRALVVGRGPVGAREMARRLQIEPTRVHRLLKTMAHIGLVRQDSERKFRPGAGIRVLGAQSILGWELLKRCVGLLGEIPRRHPHSVAVGVLWEGTVSYLARGEPERWEEGLRMTTECVEASETALGMALLSGMREEGVERIYRGATVPGIPEVLNSEIIEPSAGDTERGICLFAAQGAARIQGFGDVVYGRSYGIGGDRED